MSRKLYKVSQQANTDLIEIANYTKQNWGVTRKNEYLRAIQDLFERLSNYPNIGRQRKDLSQNLRSISIQEHIVYYIHDKNGLTVVRVLHRRRDVRLIF